MDVGRALLDLGLYSARRAAGESSVVAVRRGSVVLGLLGFYDLLGHAARLRRTERR